METVLIVIHLIVVVALVVVVLLQRSEGGGLGIGGGGGGGMMTARGTGDALTRGTAILAALFFATSLALALLHRYGGSPTDILDRVQQQQGQGTLLDSLGGGVTGSGDGESVPPVIPGGEANEPAASGTGDTTPTGLGTPVDTEAPRVPTTNPPAAQDSSETGGAGQVPAEEPAPQPQDSGSIPSGG